MFPSEIDCTRQILTFFMMIDTALLDVINFFNLLNHVMDQYSAQMANEVKAFTLYNVRLHKIDGSASLRETSKSPRTSDSDEFALGMGPYAIYMRQAKSEKSAIDSMQVETN